MTPEEAYSYRSFEHHKRETFPLIAKIVAQIPGDLRILDLSCGPAVLDGILQTVSGGRIVEAWLLDYEVGFCNCAKTHLEECIPKIHTATFDLNKPESLPQINTPLSAIVSVQALFHATRPNLTALYSYCFEHLSEGGLFLNHQNFGGSNAHLIDAYCGFMESKAKQDLLDSELMRRSHLDTRLAGGPVNQDGGSGGYKGLSIDANEHLTLLRDVGFSATEIWRQGKSAILLAQKPSKKS